MTSRFRALITIMVGAYVALLFHLYNVQILGGARAFDAQEAQLIGKVSLADRGAITFVDKHEKLLPVATSKELPLIFATPKLIDDPSEVANAVAPLLGLDIQDMMQLLESSNDGYKLLARKVSQDTAERVNDLGLPGIHVRNVAERYYPHGELGAHLLGFVAPSEENGSAVGRYGVEQFYDATLAGAPESVEDRTTVPPKAGKSLELTIDTNIQIEAERILQRTIETHRAVGGSVIVQEPKTGKILAMGSYPTFNPNNYSSVDIGTFLNPAVQEIYEPGSVFKVFTMAAGIDAGKITPQTTYYDAGYVMVSGRKIQNWDLKSHGTVTMTTVIELSLNTGAAFAERETGHTVFREYLEQFGFDRPTGIDLPGEVQGSLRRLTSNAPPVAYATASFGQGVAVTAIELVNAISTLANGGVLMRPYVNAALGSQEIRRVIKPETAQAVAHMMVSAVDRADVARIEGYTFAGKTGTAQVPDFEHGGYSDEVIHTYAGFGPTADPKFVILLKLDKPEGAPLAGTTVVPAFRDLAQFLVNYYNIPPDRIRQ